MESVFREAAKLAGCSTDEVRSFDDQDLLRAASMLERGRALLDAAEARVLGELDARGTTEAESGLTTAVWLAVEARLSRSTAKGRVKAARTMRSALDRLDDALTDGRVSFDHARALAEVCNPRIADRLAAIQGDVIDLANELPFEMWRREVTGIAQLLDEDGGHDPADDLARNQLHAVPTIDGVTHVSGKLVGEHAAIARHALDTVADELFRTFQAETEAGTVRDGEHTLPRSTLRALAFVELCRRGLATDTDSSVPPRAEVSLVVRADRPDRTVTADGEHLPTRVSKLFTCDADVTVVSVDDAGVPLHLGRSSRLATPAQRRALRVRDGGCVFPGCDTAPGWCDAHHVIHWDDGGRTDLPNLCLLCRRHHSITHRNGWSMHAHPDGDLTWTTPTGRTLHAQRHQRRRRPPADADAA